MAPEAVSRVFEEAMDWARLRATLPALPRRLLPYLEEVVAKHPGSSIKPVPCTVWVQKDDAPLAAAPELPAGYTLDTLSLDSDDAEIINEFWPYGREKFTLNEIRHLIRHRPNVCVRWADPETGRHTPVAWILQQDYKSMGMLHTLPEHRRKSLGLAVTVQLTNRLRRTRTEALQRAEKAAMVMDAEENRGQRVEIPGIKAGLHLPPPPFVYIVEGNTASEALFAGLGFTNIGFADWFHYLPPENVSCGK